MPVRLPIDRVFTVKGFGTVVTGTLWSGTIVPDQEVVVWPAGERARVRGLQVHGAAAARADAGQRVAVNLAGVSLDEIARGHVLLGEGSVLSSRRLAAEVEVLPDAPAQKHGTRMHVHLGTSVALGRLLLPAYDRAGAPRVAAPGSRTIGVLRLEVALARAAWRSPRAARLFASGDGGRRPRHRSRRLRGVGGLVPRH